MAGCVFPLGYSMGAVRISHHGEMLVVFDQFIHKRLAALIMDVIIRCSVNKKMEMSILRFSSLKGSRIDFVEKARKRDGFSDMLYFTDPGEHSFYAQPESRVGDRPVFS